MKKISEKSIQELLQSQIELIVDHPDERKELLLYGFKGIKKMTEQELLAEFNSHGLVPEYEDE